MPAQVRFPAAKPQGAPCTLFIGKRHIYFNTDINKELQGPALVLEKAGG
jgi:hypothetical protein